MKKIALLFLFSFLILFFCGCTFLQKAPAQNPSPAVNGNTPTPKIPANESQAAQSNSSQDLNSSAQAIQNISNSFAQNSSDEIFQPPIEGCAQLSGNQLALCASDLASSKKNASICTQLIDRDLRFNCLLLACASPTVGFSFCEQLPSADDRLFCLSQCSQG